MLDYYWSRSTSDQRKNSLKNRTKNRRSACLAASPSNRLTGTSLIAIKHQGSRSCQGSRSHQGGRSHQAGRSCQGGRNCQGSRSCQGSLSDQRSWKNSRSVSPHLHRSWEDHQSLSPNCSGSRKDCLCLSTQDHRSLESHRKSSWGGEDRTLPHLGPSWDGDLPAVNNLGASRDVVLAISILSANLNVFSTIGIRSASLIRQADNQPAPRGTTIPITEQLLRTSSATRVKQ